MIDSQRDGFDTEIELDRQRKMDQEILNPMKEEIKIKRAEDARKERLQKLSESKERTFSSIFDFPGNNALKLINE